MNDTAFAAGHWAEVERLAGLFHTVGRRNRAHAQFFNAEQTIIVRIEAQQGMCLRRHPQHFHREVLEGQQRLRFVGQQQVNIGPAELDDDLGIFKIRVSVHARSDLE